MHLDLSLTLLSILKRVFSSLWAFVMKLSHVLVAGAYHSILRRLEKFSNEPLRSALKVHEKRANQVLDLEEKVAAVVKKLKERGLVSPYLRSFVVARINPLRWIKDEQSLEDVLKTMRERAIEFNVDRIKRALRGPRTRPEYSIRNLFNLPMLKPVSQARFCSWCNGELVLKNSV